MVLVRDGDLKKDKDYFGFPARFKIGATKESWRDLDKIADTNVMTNIFLNLLYVYVFGVARFLPQGSFEGVTKLGAPWPAHLFLEPRKLGLGAKPDNGQDENESEITDMA